MSIQDMRRVLEEVAGPELIEIRARLDSIDKRLDRMDRQFDMIEGSNGVLYQAIIERLEQIQQSFVVDKRISIFESLKTRSA